MDAQRTLPHSEEAERTVCGAILVHNEVIENIPTLRASQFSRPHLGEIFWNQRALYDSGRPVDIVTLRAQLGPRLDDVGGAAFISALMDGVPRAADVAHYASIIQDRAERRNLILDLAKAQTLAYNTDAEPAAILASLVDNQQTSASISVPDIPTLRERLAMPVEPTKWNIVGLMPHRTRVLFPAAYKSGKTTTIANLTRSLADETPFFGMFPVVHRPDRVVVGLDNEMNDSMLNDWYRAQQIRHPDKVRLLAMRGTVAQFNILDPLIRRHWARRLKSYGTTDLILDCLRPLLDALGIDEDKESGIVLAALDALLVEASIDNLILNHHMGHSGERSRGSSRLRDWPDVEWQLLRRDTDNAASPRFFRAYGRDVDVPEGQLHYDAATRHLTIVGGSRQDAKTDAVIADIADLLRRQPEPLSGRAIKRELVDAHAKNVVDEALKRAIETSALTACDGPRGSKLYQVPPVSPLSPTVPRDGVVECPRSYIERDTGRSFTNHSSVPGGNSAERL